MRGVFSRVGDNHQIFPEDAHRVAFAGGGVNAYSVNSLTYWMHQVATSTKRLTPAVKARKLRVCGRGPLLPPASSFKKAKGLPWQIMCRR